MPQPLIFAHRGGAALRPENTLDAFGHGLSLGADGLEFDVHLSRDGVVVVHHDASLERMTGQRLPVAALTADELAGVDAGYGFTGPGGDRPFVGQGMGVPRLRDVLERWPGIRLIIELKVDDPRLARAVIDELRQHHAVGHVALGSFYGRVLRAARAYEPAIRTGAAQEETRWALYRSWVGWPAGRHAYAEFQVPESAGRTVIVSPRFIDWAHRAGCPVHVWTVDTESDMRRLIGWGVDGLITDRPDVAVPLCRR